MRSRFRNLANPLKSEGLAVLLIASLTLNVVLAWQLRRSRPDVLQKRGLSAGELAPKFRAREVAHGGVGDVEQIGYAGAQKGTLIYYFSPHCAWCEKNAANFATLAAHISGEYQIISYTGDVDGLPKYMAAAQHQVRVVTDDDVDIRRTLKLTGTPETLLISRSGRVLKNWEGAYTPAVQKEIETYFGVRLPGLAKWQTAAEFQRAGF